MKIYLASSWRNTSQPFIVTSLRRLGYEVYDFRNPTSDTRGFSWTSIDPEWPTWSANAYREALKTPPAQAGFMADFNAMQAADVGLLVLPCGRSAHLELGWMAGHGKNTIIWTFTGEEPELMALLADRICISFDEVLAALTTMELANAR